jgi:hypothetical protein
MSSQSVEQVYLDMNVNWNVRSDVELRIKAEL